MDIDLSKYKFYTNGKNVVVAVSSYAGKVVRGVAKCDPRNIFDLEKGKKLAAARCNEKIARKRAVRAKTKCAEAVYNYEQAMKNRDKMTAYYEDSVSKLIDAEELAKKIASDM